MRIIKYVVLASLLYQYHSEPTWMRVGDIIAVFYLGLMWREWVRK